jgi:site-specific DNA-methyltransferase (adenine-specific)
MSAVTPLHIGDAALYQGDCLAVLAELADNSVDAIVTDPPYGLAFMGKRWDYDVPDGAIWAECLRVLKPGGHLLAFAGTRTQHRMAIRIEDAGFEIRDMIAWVYGSGFPKSLDVSKAIDKAQRRDYVLAAVELGISIPGNNLHDWTKAEHSPSDKWWEKFKRVLSEGQWRAIEREVVGQDTKARSTSGKSALPTIGGETVYESWDITAPATPAARQWQGWGTALKPSFEPVTLARKPFPGTVAACVLAHGTGAINVDGCRVGTDGATKRSNQAGYPKNPDGTEDRSQCWARTGHSIEQVALGRFPANLIHDGSAEVVGLFPETTSGTGAIRKEAPGQFGLGGDGKANVEYGDSGSAARFFYCAKASKDDRDDGCEGLEERDCDGVHGYATLPDKRMDHEQSRLPRRNHHPTVKPTALMRYLCRLITPPGGVVLDPFMGSGSTGLGAWREGFRFIGIEREAEYFTLAIHRLRAAQRQPDLFHEAIKAEARATPDNAEAA